MNKDQIKIIQNVIDNHRKEMFTTCIETCPCWKFQAIIMMWQERHKIQLSEKGGK